ncbi:MAG: hypothetical protein R8L07_03435 [Alphaproteobacteria bacterium]|nr:hypothetical protein [Alphaproteobacteria bacterium]
MAVIGAREAAARIRAIPATVRAEIQEAVEQVADQILIDMKGLVPRDSAALAAALTKAAIEGGLGYRIGLPTEALARKFFYARFLEEGTKGGLVSFRRAGSAVPHTMRVPARARRPFMEPALDAGKRDLVAAIGRAVNDGMRRAR